MREVGGKQVINDHADQGYDQQVVGRLVSLHDRVRPLCVDLREAADVVVLKVAPLGGVRGALRVAEAHGLPCVVSSALESSVGIAAGVALAAALPELPFACGLATVALFTGDVTREPLLPVDGALPVRRPEPDRLDEVPAGPVVDARWRARMTAVRAA
jgi:O-succinylbenzoate synthase